MRNSFVQQLADERAPLSGFKSLGDLAAAVAADAAYRSGQTAPGAEGLPPVGLFSASGLNATTGAEGGFLVPTNFANEVWSELAQNPAALIGLTDHYPVESDNLTLPAAVSTSQAAGSLYGGIRGYRPSEGSQITASAPQLRALKLDLAPIAVRVVVTDRLLRSAGDALGRFLRKAAAAGIAQTTNAEIISGTGVGQMKGLLASPARIAIAKESGQTAATILAENVVKMWSRLHPASKPNAVWLATPKAEEQLDNLQVGVGAANFYRPADQAEGRAFPTLKGRHIIFCDACPALGSEGDLILTDLSCYVTGTPASGIAEASSMHLRFDYAETCFRFLLPIDGQPVLTAAITPVVGDTLSTIVTLATRA